MASLIFHPVVKSRTHPQLLREFGVGPVLAFHGEQLQHDNNVLAFHLQRLFYILEFRKTPGRRSSSSFTTHRTHRGLPPRLTHRGHRPEEFNDRTGTRTTGLQCETDEGHKIALFFTGIKHAGENLTDLLNQRRQGLSDPIHMSDGLSHNAPKEGAPSVTAADCLVHARRYFVKLLNVFPERCQYVLELFGRVYANEAYAKRQEMTPAERLAFHQIESKPVLEELHQRMKTDLKENLVEENCPLGKAYRYMLKRWQGLTVFLRVEGAELDNNAIERQLKKAILNRKNAYFYRSNRGALVGDIYMSLIYTCELNGVNPFDYLNKLQEHADDLAANPSEWMPWTYLETLKRMAPSDSPTEALPRAA